MPHNPSFEYFSMNDQDKVENILESNPQNDYYKYSGNILTFAYSKKGSRLGVLRLLNSDWFLRMEKTQATLITWNGLMDNKAFSLEEIYKFIFSLCEKDELRVVTSLLESSLWFNDMELKVLKVGDEIFSVNIWGELCKDVIIHLVNKNKPKIPFLSDYSRYLFYSDIKDECVEVNDGSDLDDAGLRQFKKKFNPIRIDDIFTLVKRE